MDVTDPFHTSAARRSHHDTLDLPLLPLTSYTNVRAWVEIKSLVAQYEVVHNFRINVFVAMEATYTAFSTAAIVYIAIYGGDASVLATLVAGAFLCSIFFFTTLAAAAKANTENSEGSAKVVQKAYYEIIDVHWHLQKRRDLLLVNNEASDMLRESLMVLQRRLEDIMSCELILRKAVDASREAERRVKLLGIAVNNRMLGTVLVTFVSVVGSALARILYYE